MAIDPSKFHRINVADSCAVWNILSSTKLYGTSRSVGCNFCITEFVHYECHVKPWSTKAPGTQEILKKRLNQENKRDQFLPHACSISDLQSPKIMGRRKRIGKGELSSLVFAMKIGQALITDDQAARNLARDAGLPNVQTTPHLFAWLIFSNRLAPSDKDTIIDEHEGLEGCLRPHFEEAFRLALQCRLNISSVSI